MGKISRAAFVKSEEITQRNAMSHIKLVKHVDTVNKFFMDEITKLQARVLALELINKENSNVSESGTELLPDSQRTDVPSDNDNPVL